MFVFRREVTERRSSRSPYRRERRPSYSPHRKERRRSRSPRYRESGYRRRYSRSPDYRYERSRRTPPYRSQPQPPVIPPPQYKVKRRKNVFICSRVHTCSYFRMVVCGYQTRCWRKVTFLVCLLLGHGRSFADQDH